MPAITIVSLSADLKSQFLDGFAPCERKIILSAAIHRRFGADSVITNQGCRADYLFLLTKGRARHFFVTAAGKKLLLQWLGPGDLIGGRTVLSRRSSFLLSTEMVTDSSALAWDRNTIRGLVARYPRLLENALLVASDYVSWHLTSYIGLACYTARQRLAIVLVTLARTIGKKAPAGFEAKLPNRGLGKRGNVTPLPT